MKNKIRLVMFVVVLLIVGVLVLENWQYVFAREVSGEIKEIERVSQNTILGTGANIPASQLFSFAVAIKDKKSSEIVTASSEDRQWAVAKKGLCAEARFFPYPPWDLERAGTFHGARLVKLYECETNAATAAAVSPPAAPAPATPPAPAIQAAPATPVAPTSEKK